MLDQWNAFQNKVPTLPAMLFFTYAIVIQESFPLILEENKYSAFFPVYLDFQKHLQVPLQTLKLPCINNERHGQYEH